MITKGGEGERVLLMGNEAIARGAVEAGVRMVTGYPGTPSSEIVQTLAGVASQRGMYVEWSVNEKVALEAAAAASFAGLRSLCVMKQVGVNVASDFLLHLAEYGTRGGLVLVSCEDPGALSSTNEGDSRPYSKMMEFPLIEPGTIQEAKDMTRWAFDLSQRLRNVVMVRSVTRMSHASAGVVLGDLNDAPTNDAEACFTFSGDIMDPLHGPVITIPGMVGPMHRRQLEKLRQAAQIFETSEFNTYEGPERPEVLLITSSAAYLYSREALALLDCGNRVGVLKLGITAPLPTHLVASRLAQTDRVLVVEEGTPFLEDNIKALAAECAARVGIKTFHGAKDGTLPWTGELNPDLVAEGLARILGIRYLPVPPQYGERAAEIASAGVPPRALSFCPGCPHRATYWLLTEALRRDNRRGFVCGDIGCYTLGAFDCGFNILKTSHAMGSGSGVASGFGKLSRFGMEQPVLAVCGDSTFFHAAMPALVNAVHNRADMILVVMDNSGTAMTGFQPHPGIGRGATGNSLPAVNIPGICEAVGARVVVCDPFDFDRSRRIIMELLDEPGGVRVLVMRQACALSPARKGKEAYRMSIDPHRCLGENCGCNRLCTRVFKCPGLRWDGSEKRARIDEVMCAGCGVCADICPAGAITREETGIDESI